MAVAYTESEAQARFPEALNRAREGETVVITRDGEPVAELRPMKREKRGEESASESQTMEERLEEMRRKGTLGTARSKRPWSSFKTSEPPVPGALQRFLDQRALAYANIERNGSVRMAVAYTESEAQARFPEALNRACEGDTVVITCEGESVAKLRPIKREKRGAESAPESQTLEEGAEEMLRDGTRETMSSQEFWRSFKPVANVPGALQRFLEERGR